MDEAGFLRGLEDNPDNVELRSAYQDWLEQKGDSRAECIRLMNDRTRLESEIQAINARIQEIDWKIQQQFSRGSQEWLDVVYPLSIRSPIVGRIYLASSPDAGPFVSVGDLVTPETIVAKIEALQIFNDITSGIHGEIAAVLVASETFVEYNQLLFKVNRPPRPIGGG